MKRRDFLKSAGILSSVSFIPFAGFATRNLDFYNESLIEEVGIQLFSVPLMLEKDFEQGIELLVNMGFKKLELFGPYPFSSVSNKEHWAALTPRLGFSGSGYFGKTETEVKRILDNYGLSVPSIHTDLDTLEAHMPDIAKAKEVLDFEFLVLPALPAEKRVTMDDYRKTAELFNSIGKSARQVGLKFAYHNHGYGLSELEGQIPMQYLIENTDPDWVFLEMDLFWTTAGRAEPLDYLKNYPGRYHLMHVKDMKTKQNFSGDGGDPGQWMELFPHMCSAGDGVLDLEKIIPQAIESGVKHFIVEQDMVQDPAVALQKSIDYLKSL